VELAFLIDKTRWGEGLATEACLGIIQHARNALGLQRLICLVMPGNLRSAAVATKVGMCFESECTANTGFATSTGAPSGSQREQSRIPIEMALFRSNTDCFPDPRIVNRRCPAPPLKRRDSFVQGSDSSRFASSPSC